MALRWLSAVLAAGVLAGCGGSGGDAPAPVGDPASATIGQAGGSIAFTASGVPGKLEFPAGVLAAETVVTVTPLEPGDGEWARVSITGPEGVLPAPAVLRLSLPDTAFHGSAGVVVQGGGVLPLTTVIVAGGLSLEIELQNFAAEAGAAPATARRARALAAHPAATPAAPPPPVAARRQVTPQERLDALRRAIEAHEARTAVDTGLNATLAVAAVRQMINGDDPNDAREALQAIAQATDKACTALRNALLAATVAPVPPNLNEGDDTQSAHWIFRVMGPVLYWQAVVMKLGGDPCAGADVEGVLNSKLTELLNWVRSKAAQRQDTSAFGQILKPVPQAAELATHAAILQAPPLQRLVTTTIVEPAMVPLRAIAWETAQATQAHYLLVFSQLSLYAGPFRDDVQLARTTLQVGSYRDAAATQLEGQAVMGRRSTPQESIRAWTVSAKAGGKVALEGPIDVLHCADAASERLVVEFEGHEVYRQASSGDRLLLGRLEFAVDRLLGAAGIAPANATQHVLRVWRKGSTCNTAFGTGDAVVAEITLDFTKICRPAEGDTHCATTIDVDGRPIQIYRARFLNKRGTVHFYTLRDPSAAMPYDFWVLRQGRATQLPADFTAVAMNNEDTLVGNAPMARPPNATIGWRSPAIWRPEGYSVLDLAGGLHDVNDAGNAVGNANLICNDIWTTHGPFFNVPLRVRNGAPSVAPPPPGWDADSCRAPTWSYLTSINNGGQECEHRESASTGPSANCEWINDGGRQTYAGPGTGDLILSGGQVLPGGASGFVRLGNWHALDQNRQQVINMRTGADMPPPRLSAASGLTSSDLKFANWMWVDDLGRVLLHHHGSNTPARVLTPAGVERP